MNLDIYEPKSSALEIFLDRYAIHKDETFAKACERVSRTIADAEMGTKRDEYFARFLEILQTNRFSPGGRIWRGAGRPRGQLLNCFCVPAEDSREGWGDVLRNVTIISGTGGGVGINFSKIRPRGTPIRGTGGEATGAVSLMKATNAVCNELREGGGRRCLPEGTLIHTKYGLKRIEDIQIGDLVLTNPNKYKRVLCAEHIGKKRMTKIDTQMGVFESSPEHRWAVLSSVNGDADWVEARNLKKDDRLIFVDTCIPGQHVQLPSFENEISSGKKKCATINIPPLDNGISWLIGYLHGDGCVSIREDQCHHHGQISFCCPTDIDGIREKIIENINKFTNQKMSDYVRTRYYYLVANIYNLAKYFSQFKKPNQPIVIPEFILNGTPGTRSSYIAGILDADGYLGKRGTLSKRPVKIVTSIYPDYAKQLRALLASLGMVSKLNQEKRLTQSGKFVYELNLVGNESIEKFIEFIGPYSLKYQRDGVALRVKEHHALTVPSKLMKIHPNKINFNFGYQYTSNCGMSVIEQVEGKKWYRPIKVIDIEDRGQTKETYDIEVEDDSVFVAEGLLVHNSALLYCLDWRHADLLEFLSAKLDKKELNNANISVLVDDEFFKLLDNKGDVVFKWQGEERGRIAAQDLWDKIIQNAWEGGDPGLLNIGLMNEQNTISYVSGGEISSPNPCAEATLEEYGCCCLGALNLSTHIIDGEMDWDLLEETVAIGVRFLDNVLEQNNYPLPLIQQTSQKHRRIGLGVMGLHDMLIKLGLKYSTQTARDTVDEVMSFIKKQAYHASISLAIEKGPFQAFNALKHTKTGFAKKHLTRRHHRLIQEHGIRNCALLAAAPTGTISLVAGCSSGIEPIFQAIHKRRFNKHRDTHDDKKRNGTTKIMVHPLLKAFLEVGKSTKCFENAHEISPENHLAMQAVCQKHIDNAISKTVNIPTDFSVEQLSSAIRKHIGHLKGITIYRDGSRSKSPLTPVPLSEAKQYLDKMEQEAAVNDCPSGTCDIPENNIPK